MTKHLYFTDYTKVLYMMKEFRVLFRDIDSSDKWYVAPESYHIFEQKEGDIGILVTKEFRDDRDYLAIVRAFGRLDFVDNFVDFVKFNETISPSKYWKIIMRDNKLFFQPETE